MFDLGWQEFLMVAFVLVIVVGPKDLPKVLRAFTKFSNQARSMARDFTSSLNELADDEEVRDLKKMVQNAKSGELDEVAALLEHDIKSGLDDSTRTVKQEIEEIQLAGQQAGDQTGDQAGDQGAAADTAKAAEKTVQTEKTGKKA